MPLSTKKMGLDALSTPQTSVLVLIDHLQRSGLATATYAARRAPVLPAPRPRRRRADGTVRQRRAPHCRKQSVERKPVLRVHPACDRPHRDDLAHPLSMDSRNNAPSPTYGATSIQPGQAVPLQRRCIHRRRSRVPRRSRWILSAPAHGKQGGWTVCLRFAGAGRRRWARVSGASGRPRACGERVRSVRRREPTGGGRAQTPSSWRSGEGARAACRPIPGGERP